MTKDARALIEALDGAGLEKKSSGWNGFFEGTITVPRLEERVGSLEFDIVLPTSEFDIDDFIWSKEQAAGTTDKVVLAQDGVEVPDARVTRIVREGKSERWVKADSDRYRITFEVAKAALRPGEPVEVHVRWDGVDVAVARGR